jgi:aryl-alcohol dehydrogenase-like predicted oxidoreductase
MGGGFMDNTNGDLSAAAAGTVRIGDFTVNRMGFGAMRITGEGIWGEPNDRDRAKNVLKRAVELGVNFIDTADAYGPEVSENLIAEALRPYKGLVVATKGGLTRGGPGQWTPDGSPAHLREACEASLKRLNLDTIDLYQFHRPDPKVPFEESVQTLADLQKEGKIKHIGLSNVSVEQIKQAQKITAIVSVQNHYNLQNREHEEVLQFCEQNKMVFIPYFPIGGKDSAIGEAGQSLLTGIAAKYHASVRQIALAWLLRHSSVTLPIPGTSSIEHLEENIRAAAIELSDDEISSIDSLS